MDYNPAVKLELAQLPQENYWQIPLAGAEYLKATVARLKPKLILEVGTSSGYSALWMSEALIEAGLAESSKIITIESNQKRYDFASENFKKAGVQNLVQNIKGHAPAAIPVGLNFDFAFFDATKSQTADFFDTVWPYLNPQSEILVDNVISHAEKMQPFFQHLDNLKIPYQVLDLGAGLCKIEKA
jgi:predicted O-methyltransferase YrrM